MLTGVALLAGCQERLTTPADCPTLCPGTSLEVFDTVLVADVNADSTFDGYLSLRDIPSLLVSNGLVEREARAFVRFEPRSDSVTVSGALIPYTIDSVAFVFDLEGRDPAARNLKVYLHRIARAPLDTLTTFDAIESQLTSATLVDSFPVADSIDAGSDLRVVIAGPTLERMTIAPEDSGVVAIALRVAADRPTGLRVRSALTPDAAPRFVTYARVDVADTSLRRQTITIVPNFANYALQSGEPSTGDDAHLVGTRSARRALLRFTVPDHLRDSISIIRATLELTPKGPIPGLEGDPGSLELRGVVSDFGAKSPVISSLAAFHTLTPASEDAVNVDVRNVVAFWFLTDGAPSALFLRVTPEGGTFSLPEFFSTRAPAGGPRLRITYARPTRPGHP